MKLKAILPLFALAAIGAQSGSHYVIVSRAGIDVRTSLGHFEVATIVIDASTVGGGRGEATFAADGHHHGMYPDLVAMVPQVSSARVRGNRAELTGSGTFQGEPATIRLQAQDGGPNGRGDRMWIECFASDGRLVFRAEGSAISGDISIRRAP